MGSRLRLKKIKRKQKNKIMHLCILLSNQLNTALERGFTDQEAAMRFSCLVCRAIEDISWVGGPLVWPRTHTSCLKKEESGHMRPRPPPNVVWAIGSQRVLGVFTPAQPVKAAHLRSDHKIFQVWTGPVAHRRAKVLKLTQPSLLLSLSSALVLIKLLSISLIIFYSCF